MFYCQDASGAKAEKRSQVNQVEAQVRMREQKRSSPWSELKGLLCRSVRLAGAFIPFILPLASNQSIIQKGHVHTAGNPRVKGDRSACLLVQTTDFNGNLKWVCKHLCQEIDFTGGCSIKLCQQISIHPKISAEHLLCISLCASHQGQHRYWIESYL